MHARTRSRVNDKLKAVVKSDERELHYSSMLNALDASNASNQHIGDFRGRAHNYMVNLAFNNELPSGLFSEM